MTMSFVLLFSALILIVILSITVAIIMYTRHCISWSKDTRLQLATFGDEDLTLPFAFLGPSSEACLDAARRGRSAFADLSVAIVMVSRDNEVILPKTLRRCEMIERAAKDARTVVYENDSADKSAVLLSKWAAERPDKRRVWSETGVEFEKGTSRIAKITKARNKSITMLECWEKEDSDFRPDYVIVMDADLVGGFDHDGFFTCFAPSLASRCDAIFPRGYSYDSFAAPYTKLYKALGWERGMYDMIAFSGLGNTHPNVKTYEDAGYRNMPYRVRADDATEEDEALMFVESAFNGCGVYRRSFFTGPYRCTRPEDDRIHCEHFVRNAEVYARGGRLCVNRWWSLVR